MACKKCDSKRVMEVTAKCSDMCVVKIADGDTKDGYVPCDLAIGGGDYVEFKLCLDCGVNQGTFPLPKHEMEESDG